MKLSRTAKRNAPSRQRPCGCKMGKKKGWGGAKEKRQEIGEGGKGRAGRKRWKEKAEGKEGRRGGGEREKERKRRGRRGIERAEGREERKRREEEKRKKEDRESKCRALVCSQSCIALKSLYSFGYTDVHALLIWLVPGTQTKPLCVSLTLSNKRAHPSYLENSCNGKQKDPKEKAVVLKVDIWGMCQGCCINKCVLCINKYVLWDVDN